MTQKASHRDPLWQRLLINGAICLIILCFFLGAIQHFVLNLPRANSFEPPKNSDGIVVATGGQARLKVGLTLLSQKTAPHLLVSGVGSGISKEMIARSIDLSDAEKKALECCVDLDFSAADTLGNAVAADHWAEQRSMRSLILVTSDYHMPRAALEFSRYMPHRTIIAYPITAPDLAQKSWYSDWSTLRLYSREYLKYLYRRLALAVGF